MQVKLIILTTQLIIVSEFSLKLVQGGLKDSKKKKKQCKFNELLMNLNLFL